MKKTIGVLLAAGVIFAAFSSQSNADLGRFEALGKDRFSTYGHEITLFRDTKTGCQYMRVSTNSAGQVIEPVLNKDGKPYCGKASVKPKKKLYISEEDNK
ncbi:DUF6440 family protein [Priestia megaterium]|uniref:DUF6440 family protein n=1 Tax=Priestia megaterium TaxID=1404 RepID=UPI001129DAB9|nr:DUF6440 family protein [Priestia megaterium]TPF18021.1 hypothetical protein CBE78_01995 [Priestia megaterium]TPF22128.1 hypothetical protein CBE79_04500 [Priestia megaterium]